MYNTSDYVKEDLCFQRLLRRKYLQQLRGLPAGGLSTSIIKNQTYYYKVLDGKKIYIGKADCKEVAQLQKRRFIENSVMRIDGATAERISKRRPRGGHGRRNKGLSDAAGMQLFYVRYSQW